MRRLHRSTALVGLALAAGLVAGAPAGAGVRSEPDDDGADAGRVLVVSLPHIGWDDLDLYDLPNIERFLADSGVAALTTRSESRATRTADGYLTFGAGTRAVGDPLTDGDAFGVDEPFGEDTAGQVFTQRTGRVAKGTIVSLASPRIFQGNRDLLYDAEIGALADALADEGVTRAVIGNADGRQPDSPPSPTISTHRRQVALGLMSSAGTVSAGAVDDGLLRRAPAAPYGVVLDQDAVLAAFEAAWTDRAVVLVEASDLVRADAYRTWASVVHKEVMLERALERTDEMVGQLLERVDLERDAVVLFGPAHANETISTTLLGVHVPGGDAGLLRSGTTRRSGFVQLIDVAPTILDILGIERPTSMEGRPAEVGSEGGSAEDRAEFLTEADAAAQFRDERVGQVQTAFVVFAAAIALGLVLLVRRPRPAAFATWLGRIALCVLAFTPATFLARLLPLHEGGSVAYWSFLVVVAIALGALYLRVGRENPVDGLLVALLFTIALLVIDVVLGAHLIFNSALGYSPIVAGRFAGLSNPAYAALGACTVLAAPLLARRIGGRRGVWVAVALMAGVIVVDGAPFWGSDVGGMLSLVPAFGVTAILLLGWKVRWATVGWCVVGLVLVVGAFTALDMGRAPEHRTHLGRLVERIQDNGLGDFVVIIQRKLAENLGTLTHSVWGIVLPIVLLLSVWFVRRAPERLRAVSTALPETRVALVGFGVLAVLGYALNDSGIAIPGLMLAIALAAAAWLLTRIGEGAPIAAKAPPAKTAPKTRARAGTR